MRATTRAMPNVSRATRAAMMLELSPLETAAKAWARSTPASTSTSRWKPWPTTWLPEKSAESRRKACRSLSITATSWPSRSRLAARDDPTRPQPMMTTYTAARYRREARFGAAPADEPPHRLRFRSALDPHLAQTHRRRTTSTQRPAGAHPPPQAHRLPVFASDPIAAGPLRPRALL